jgi:hypothetical protein
MDSTLQTVLVVVAAAAGVAWIAATAATAGFGMHVRSGEDAQAVVDYARRMARITSLVALPAAVLAAAAGGWYLADRDVELAANWWAGTAIGAWIVAFFGATLLRAPQLQRAVGLAGVHGADDEDVQWRIRQVDLTSRGELVLLVVAVLVVVLQPS